MSCSTRTKKTAARRRLKERNRFLAAVALMKDPQIFVHPAIAPDSMVVIDQAQFEVKLAPDLKPVLNVYPPLYHMSPWWTLSYLGGP